MKRLILFVALTALAGCINGQPPMETTHNGQPCHPIGYSFAPVWVTPDGKTACLKSVAR
jgi:hypothetical protein